MLEMTKYISYKYFTGWISQLNLISLKDINENHRDKKLHLQGKILLSLARITKEDK